MTTFDSQLDRRSFLKLAAGTVAFMAGGSIAHGSLPETIKASLAYSMASDLPRLDGVFVFDHAVCRAMADDFGHFVHRMLIGVLFPKSVRDIQKIVAYAKRKSLKVAMRGHGCSAYGQAQVKEGIVIDAAEFKKMRWVGAGAIDAQPGATWHEVVTMALTRQRTPPVLPDTLFLTVGGTLSAGGICETSYRLGGQVDHVLELDVVTGSGELVTCSRLRSADLFNACLAGMGQCGIIVRARLSLEKAPLSVENRELRSPDLASFLSDLTLIAQEESNDAIAGHLVRSTDGSWSYLINVATAQEPGTQTHPPPWLSKVSSELTGPAKATSFESYANRNTKGYLDAVANGSILVPHPYMSFFSKVSETSSMLDWLAKDPTASLGAAKIAAFPILNRYFFQPLQRLPDSALSFHVRIYRKAKVEGSVEHREMIRLNEEAVSPRLLASGGTVYPPHAPVLSAQQWEQHFGNETMRFFARAKQKLDPSGLLNPGSGIFAPI